MLSHNKIDVFDTHVYTQYTSTHNEIHKFTHEFTLCGIKLIGPFIRLSNLMHIIIIIIIKKDVLIQINLINFYSLNVLKMTLVQPSGDMSAKIREELREPDTPEAIERDVAAIKEWLTKQPHLPKDMGRSFFGDGSGFLMIFFYYN